jgi:hypothetical protein
MQWGLNLEIANGAFTVPVDDGIHTAVTKRGTESPLLPVFWPLAPRTMGGHKRGLANFRFVARSEFVCFTQSKSY